MDFNCLSCNSSNIDSLDPNKHLFCKAKKKMYVSGNSQKYNVFIYICIRVT